MHRQAETSGIEEVQEAGTDGDGARAGAAGDFRVMVIDDSKTIRRTAETLLRKEGFDVVGVIAIVDRLEGGADAIRDAGVAFSTLYDRADFMEDA